MLATMKAPRLALAILALASLSYGQTNQGGAYVYWDPIYPTPGYDTYTSTITVNQLPNVQSSYYWALFNGFVGGENSFQMGLQPYGSCGIANAGNCKIALFSVFGNGATSTSQTCAAGADGGTGVSCRIPYEWVVGRPYKFIATLTANDGTLETWTGSVTDTVSGVQTTIGAWSIPSSNGLIGRQGVSFTQYYAPYSGGCGAEPYAQVTWNVPIGYNKGQAYPGSVRSTTATSGCPQNFTSTVNSSSVVVQTGGSVGLPAAQPLRFVPVTPCRVADTRNAAGGFGGPSMTGGTPRDFNIPSSACGIPTTAAAYSLNVTVVPKGPLSYLSLWPSGSAQPLVSTLNSLDGRIKANAALVPAGADGSVSVFVTDATEVILDINGYFEANNPADLVFYALPPCRVADTRNPAGLLGGPIVSGGQARSFPVLTSTCNVPATARAYSLNITAVPTAALGYLTAWPTGIARPLASTLNALTGTVTANAALIPAGAGGAVSVYVSDDSHVVLDVNGYFAPPAAGGLRFYPIAPCRAVDTRSSPAGLFNGPALSAQLTRSFPLLSSPCPLAPSALAYSLNATVIPPARLGYLSLWQTGQAQPMVSTLNALDSSITSNAAIVPAGDGGAINAFSSNATNVLFDVNGYFAP